VHAYDGTNVVDQFKRLKQFIVETWSELKKTSWPSRKEVYGTTVVVVVTVLFTAFYLWVVDLFLSKSMNQLFEWLR
jgi:preprotein translocase subunit SecE